MPPRPDATLPRWGGTPLIGLSIGLPLASSGAQFPLVSVPVGIPTMLYAIAAYRHRRSPRRLAAGRPGESICTFARSFDCRETDTWIVRAMFEELQPAAKASGRVLPIRREDRLDEILVAEELELEDLIIDAASRAGRSVAGYEEKPRPFPVRTVADLVAFLMLQPPKPATA